MALSRAPVNPGRKPTREEEGTICKAAETDDVVTLRKLISSGVDVTGIVNLDNQTALHIATKKGNNSVVSALITAGANVNATDIYNKTALHYAAHKGSNSVVSALITAGANVNATEKWGSTPVHWAACNGHTDVVAILVANGGDVNMKDEDGGTPLDDALSKNHSGVVSYLIQNGGIDLTKFDQEKQQKIRDLMKEEGKSTEWHLLCSIV